MDLRKPNPNSKGRAQNYMNSLMVSRKAAAAHEYALQLIALGGPNGILDLNQVASLAWKLADHMEAEERKRLDTSRPDVLQDEPKKVDWLNEAPTWANYLFFDELTQSVIWSEDPPEIETGYSIIARGAVTKFTCGPGRSKYAGDGYKWVDDLHKRPNYLHPRSQQESTNNEK